MTETGQVPEPTNSDLLAFMQQAFAHLTTEISKTNAKVDGLATALAHAEARLASRIGDVQQVVQSVKADLAAHIADDHDHRHAA
jgi:hypothetical protein